MEWIKVVVSCLPDTTGGHAAGCSNPLQKTKPPEGPAVSTEIYNSYFKSMENQGVHQRFAAESVRQMEIRLQCAKTYHRFLSGLIQPDNVAGQTNLIESEVAIQGLQDQLNTLRHELLSDAQVYA